MDRGAVAKKSRRRRKKNPQQEKEPVYFSNDTILEAVKFLNYKKWSQMRFLCHRFNQLIHSNQANLQAFEVKSLSMSEIHYFKSNSIVSFDQGIQPAKAARKWFQDREKNMLLTSQAKQMNKMRWGKARKKNRRLLNSVTLESKTPELFSAKFNDQYKFYGPILSHFFRLLHHPNAYFREISMFLPMTDKFCDEASKNLIRCEQLTLMTFNTTLEQSLKWLKDNVRAQQIILSFSYIDPFLSHDKLHSLVSEFLLLDASICARDCIKLDGLRHPEEFVSTLIEKYETLEVTKAIPTIELDECGNFNDSEILKPSFVVQYDPRLYDKRCDSCNIKTYELPIKSDGSRKIIAQAFCLTFFHTPVFTWITKSMTRQWEITDRHIFDPSTALKSDLFEVPHTSAQLTHSPHKALI
ncbi:hypothetical protein Ddc_20774 [Ditylenchus destructor]|nr:hypothetical protein Ddc_20774 [Ditylenchus destructor]